MKKEISLAKANRLINSGALIMVTSCYKDKQNIITLAWNSPLSHNPPLLGISIAKTHLSSELIKKSKEFVVNVPSLDLLDKIVFCGTHHGHDIDKFKEAKLTAVKANRLVNTPLIKECIGHLECLLRDVKEAGDHILFIGEVISASVEESLFNDTWLVDKVKLAFHLGGSDFTSSNELVRVK
ncbi:MAG: flavin reductase family protein [Candidatus Omnitrophica bacterium]|nr:flavin reductase family protein [Candidatus Omnitrophota bacterium]HOX54616.1 flavin reductase family protein [Candidatus Omnitrophota bacterium]